MTTKYSDYTVIHPYMYVVHLCVLCVHVCVYMRVFLHVCTINVERFAGLNISGFSHMKVFAGIRLRYFGQQCLL